MISVNGKKPGPKARNIRRTYFDPFKPLLNLIRFVATAARACGFSSFIPEKIETTLAVSEGRFTHRMVLGFKHLTLSRFINFWLIELQLLLGMTRVWGYPYEWEIDTTNICQLKCPLCHTGLDNIRRVKGIMHFDTFRKTIDEIKDYVIWLSLYSWGEPLLNKQIPKFIDYAHKAKIATIISTNLSLPLKPERVEEIIESGLDVMIVSLDGLTQEVYEQYRVRGNLPMVMKNLRLFVEKKKELKSKTPYIEWQFIVMKQNEGQIPEARRMAKEIGVDQIVFKKVDFPHGMGDDELAQKWFPVHSPEFRRENPQDKPYNENSGRCWRLWRSAVVNWDGGYAPCCYLTDAAHDFGNVNEKSIKSIWNGKHYKTARNLFKNGDRPEVTIGCLTCDVYLTSPNGRKHGQTFIKEFNLVPKEKEEDKAEAQDVALRK